MEQELLRLVEKHKDDVIDYDVGNGDDFKKLYYKKLIQSPSKRRNVKIFLQYLDIVLKYTTSTNDDWITYPIVYHAEGFIEQLSKNLKYFPDKTHLVEFLSLLWVCLDDYGSLKRDELFTEHFIDALLDFHLSGSQYGQLMDKMTKEQRKYFLKASISKKVSISFYYFDLSKEEQNIIEDNISSIIEYSTYLISLRDQVKSNNSKEIICDYMNQHPKQVVESILNYRNSSFIQNQDFVTFLTLLFMDIADSEQVPISNIQYIGMGGYSIVFQLENKIIKLGENRGTKTLPNNPYIIQPLLRKTVKIGNDELFIEVTEKVETLKGDFNELNEEVYQLYKKIRNLGLVWTDVNIRNVGRLLKDNVIHWKEELQPTDETLEFSSFHGNQVLKAGELVLLDADYIFLEHDEKIIVPENAKIIYREFEERYQQEKLVIPSISNEVPFVEEEQEQHLGR